MSFQHPLLHSLQIVDDMVTKTIAMTPKCYRAYEEQIITDKFALILRVKRIWRLQYKQCVMKTSKFHFQQDRDYLFWPKTQKPQNVYLSDLQR